MSTSWKRLDEKVNSLTVTWRVFSLPRPSGRGVLTVQTYAQVGSH